MIEVKLIGSPANDAPPTIPFPDLKLYMCRNHTAPCCIGTDWHIQVVLTLHGYELEFEHLAPIADLSPRVNKMEDSVVRPDTLAQLFVHTNALRRAVAGLRLLCSTEKQTILRQ
jgi:hypothetical protein